MYDFKFYLGEDIKNNGAILDEMEKVANCYNFLAEENVLQYIDNNSKICCFYKDNALLGFSWLEFCESEAIAELCWFVMNKNKSKGIEGKLLLDKTLDFCKQNGITSVKFNCAEASWGRIKDPSKLFKSFGYSLSDDENDYDMSIYI